MFNKLKQFKQLKDQAKQLQTELKKQEVTGQALSGKIAITMNGNQEVTNVLIDAELLSSDQKEKLQEGVKTACNDAMNKTRKIMMDQMKQMKDFDLSSLGL